MNEVTQPERGRGKVLSALAMVAALTAFLAFAPLASAASDPVASGTTSILMKKGFIKTLKRNGVKLQKVSPGTLSGRTLAATVGLPVKEGEVDPTTGAATLTHEGGFKFKHGKKKAPVTELVLTTSNSSLTAKVAGKKMKFASVVGYTFTRNGFGVNFTATKLKLTSKAAKQLNKKLGFTGKKGKKKGKRAHAAKTAKGPFKANQVFGNASGEEQPKTLTVQAGGNASLTTSLPTVKKFGELFVEIAPIAPASAEPALPPVLLFPISGGTIAPDASSGKVATSGGVKLTQAELAPGIQISMTLNVIEVDLTAKVASVEVSIDSTNQEKAPTPGNVGRASIATIDLAGATITSDPNTHTVSVQNASSALQAVTAETLNEVFSASKLGKEGLFVEGDPLGTFSFSVQTQ